MPLSGKIVIQDGIVYQVSKRVGVIGYEDGYTFPKVTEIAEYIDGKPVEYIGEGAFENCPLNINEVVLPPLCLDIKSRAFRNCKSLTFVSYLNSFTNAERVFIGEKAFEDCTNLLGFVAHDVHLWVMDLAFHNCHKMDTLLGSLFVTKGVIFKNCKSLSLVFVADGAFLSAKTFGNAVPHKIIFSGMLKRPSKSMFDNLKGTILACRKNFVFSDLVFDGYNMMFIGDG